MSEPVDLSSEAEPAAAAGPHSPPPGLGASISVALAAAGMTFAGAALLLWGTGPKTLAGLDFNAALFEDFLGPYWATAEGLLAGAETPAAGYLYPSTLAWLLTPLAWVQQRLVGPPPLDSTWVSWTAVLFVLASFALLFASAFALMRPKSLTVAAIAGAVFGLAHAPVHGAYWAQASLPAIALLAAGFALLRAERTVLAGAAVGLAGALKLHPLIGLVALAVHRRSGERSPTAAVSACVTFALFAVALPLLAMGPGAFFRFHSTVFERLKAMNAWVMTRDGGRGSQDLPAILGRALPLESALARQAVGWAVGGFLVWLAVRALRSESKGTSRTLPAFVFLAAVPWAAVSPAWPHGLLWVPVAWWAAWNSPSRISWVLAAGSFAAGSVLALRALGAPETYAWYGLPAWSAVLALSSTAAAVFARDGVKRD